MEIKTKFSINDTVWFIGKDRKKEWKPCLACSASGKIILADKKERMCPECYGHCGKNNFLETAWMVLGELTIGQVEATIRNLEKDDGFDNIGGHKPGGDKYKCRYMAYETGIGTGSCYDEDKLFGSEEEAKKECDNRNNG